VARRWFIAFAFVLALNFWAWLFWRWRQEHRYDALIRAAAVRYGAAPDLIKAVIWQESRFDASAVGGKGELGLMQVMEDAALEWASSARVPAFDYRQTIDPGTNVLAGTYYLVRLLKRYTKTDDPVAYALADYNAGRGNVLRWMKGPAATNSAAFLTQMTFPSTRAYVIAIRNRRPRYREDFR
jgi:soluble lytic murein transglycosylase